MVKAPFCEPLLASGDAMEDGGFGWGGVFLRHQRVDDGVGAAQGNAHSEQTVVTADGDAQVVPRFLISQYRSGEVIHGLALDCCNHVAVLESRLRRGTERGHVADPKTAFDKRERF